MDPDVDITKYGDPDEVQINIRQYKLELSGNEKEEEFFNWMVDSMSEKYRDILMKKSIDQLVTLATNKGIFVRRKASKESIVDKILARMDQRRERGL